MTKTPTVVSLVALLLFISIPSLSGAELLEGELEVYGMACPFCGFGIEKKLRAVPGVAEVTIFLDEGRIQLAFSPGNDAVPGDIEGAVEKAGFKLSTLLLTVQGAFAEDDSQPVLVAGTKARFLLLDEKRREAISGEALQRLQAVARSGRVVVTGTVVGKVDGLPALVLSNDTASKR